jgi:Protein of unknown function (DUF3102)
MQMTDPIVPAIVQSVTAELDNLARRINDAHDLAEKSARTALEHAHKLGKMLVEAKACVRHGDWLKWLTANTKLTARTAQRYIRLAKYDTLSQLAAERDQEVVTAQRSVAICSASGRTPSR